MVGSSGDYGTIQGYATVAHGEDTVLKGNIRVDDLMIDFVAPALAFLAQIDFAEYIDSLAAYLLRTYRASAQDIRLKVTAQGIRIGIDVAVPCGLILNELVSNALKHAFPDGREGEIHIELDVDDSHQATLVVGDNGVGLSKDVDLGSVKSLGLRLVALLAGQLDSTVEIDRRDGTEYSIKFGLMS